MNILIISHSQNKERIESLRLLDRYLPRVGVNTWSGSMKQPVLDNLLENLTDKHDLSIYKNGQIFYHNGPTALEIEEKSMPIIKTSKLTKGDIKRTQSYLIYTISIISAIFHDIGKISNGFQSRLRNNKKQSNIIRHELLSYLAFAWITRKDFLDTDQKLIQALSKYNEQCIPTWIEDINYFFKLFLKPTNEFSTFLKYTLEKKVLENNPDQSLIQATSLVILSHHILPILDNGYIDFKTSIKNYLQVDYHKLFSDNKHYEFGGSEQGLYATLEYKKLQIEKMNRSIKNKKNNASKEEAITVKDNYILAQNHDEIEFHRLVKNISHIMTDIKNELQNINTYINMSLLSDVIIISRNLMIIADNYASDVSNVNNSEFKLSENKLKAYHHNLLYANTNKKGLADTLKRHMLKVIIGTHKVFKHLNTLYHGIDVEEIPDILNEPSDEKYKWQNDAVNYIQDHYQNGGFLSLVISSTGSGKTIGNIKIMNAVSNELRITTLLPMRSLTSQSNLSYKKLGFQKSDISMIMGGIINQTSNDLNNDSEFLLEGNIDNINKKHTHSIYHSAGMKGDLLDAFLLTPIVICTTDMLIDFVNMQKKSGVSLMLRAMTSDLIIDEIDNYSYEDQIILSRLIYYAGLFGRKIIASSATMNKYLASSIHNAYVSGFTRRNEFYKNETPLQTFIISDNNTKLITNDFDTEWEDYINNYNKFLLNKNIKQSLSLFKIDSDHYKEQFLEKAIELHKENAIYENGIKLSIGVIRFNNIEQCQKMTEYLMDNNILPEYARIVCIHSRFPMSVRNKIEAELNTLLNRHQNNVFDNPHIKNIPGNEIMVIVLTTPLLETGRDYDFDWGITEPCSDQSLIQFSGRIRRHRHEEYLYNNIALSNHTIKNILSKTNKYHIIGPGIDTPIITGQNSYPNNPVIEKEQRNAENLFDISFYSKRINNSQMFNSESDKEGMKIILNISKNAVMGNTANKELYPYSIMGYLMSDYNRFNRDIYLNRTWRRKSNQYLETIYYLSYEENELVILQSNKQKFSESSVSPYENLVNKSKFLLLPISCYLVEKNNENSIRMTFNSKNKLQYDNILGMVKRT